MGQIPWRMKSTKFTIVLLCISLMLQTLAWQTPVPRPSLFVTKKTEVATSPSRLSISLPLHSALLGLTLSLIFTSPPPSLAIAPADCQKDCIKNCKLIAPKDTSGYCENNCNEYCAQTDRTDGLSGSVSSTGGEVGILGGSIPGSGTVVKGEDKVRAVTELNNVTNCLLLGYFNPRIKPFSFRSVSLRSTFQPPSVKLPGLDFNSASGKKLLGY